MEMCYDGALVMPSRYAVMGNDEMTYLEGGKAYSGAQGWACASLIAAVGTGISHFAKVTAKACLPYITGMLVGGPLGWVCASITVLIGGASLGALAYLGGQFASAGAQALYYMGTKGRFTIKANNNIFSLFSVGY